MLMKEKSERNTLEMISLEHLVPRDHLLRKIDYEVDFAHIYDFVEDLYYADNGCLSIDLVPHFATISYNFRHRFTEETIEKIFTRILYEAQKSGYLLPETVFMDATHIKANANINKNMKKAIPTAAKAYEEQLLKEINEGRRAHGESHLMGAQTLFCP